MKQTNRLISLPTNALGSFCVGTLLLLVLATLPAKAQDVWEDTGNWQVMTASTDTRRCYATRTLEDGSIIEIGAEPSMQGGYFAIYNAAWTHIEEGDKGTVEFNFGSARFGGDAEARFLGGRPGGYVFFNNPAFVDAFANRQNVKIVGRSGFQFDMDLTGTKKAVATVLACQAAQVKSGK